MGIHFLSGKDKGQEAPLPEHGEVILGKTDDERIVLDDPKAAKKVAEISQRNDQIEIRGLEADTKLLVNGVLLKESPLNEGDRVKIGTVNFMLIRLGKFSQTGSVNKTGKPAAAAARPATARSAPAGRPPARPQNEAGRIMAGSLKDVSVSELLQLMSHSGKSGVLSLTCDSNFGKIFLRSGTIYYSSINDSPIVHMEKALYRMLRWNTGTFSLGPADEAAVPTEMNLPTDSLLLEAAHHNDSITSLLPELPNQKARLSIARPFPGRLRDVSKDELDTLQDVLEYGSLEQLLDNVPLTDLEICTKLVNFLQKKFIVAG